MLDISESFVEDPNKPRIANCWSTFCNNILRHGCKSFCWRKIATPSMDNLINKMKDRIV